MLHNRSMRGCTPPPTHTTHLHPPTAARRLSQESPCLLRSGRQLRTLGAAPRCSTAAAWRCAAATWCRAPRWGLPWPLGRAATCPRWQRRCSGRRAGRLGWQAGGWAGWRLGFKLDTLRLPITVLPWPRLLHCTPAEVALRSPPHLAAEAAECVPAGRSARVLAAHCLHGLPGARGHPPVRCGFGQHVDGGIRRCQRRHASGGPPPPPCPPLQAS